jgi:hypothetical protein
MGQGEKLQEFAMRWENKRNEGKKDFAQDGTIATWLANFHSV